jgi:hypothetical protein
VRSFISWFLGLKEQAIRPDAELTLRFNQALEGWQVFLLAAGVIAFAVWIYRRDGRGTASPWLRAFLGVLRGLLIALTALILAEPALLATHIETRRSTVLVLLDDSYSMDLAFADADEALRKKLQAAMRNATVTLRTPEGAVEKVSAQKMDASHFRRLTRLDVVSTALQVSLDGGKDFLAALGERHDVKLYTFSRQISASTDDNQPLDVARLTPSSKRGMETRIGDCLREGLRQLRGQPLAGVVIVSDGRQNAGEDAVQAAQACRMQHVPIFAVGVGDPSEPKDFELSVEGPDMILPDDQSECTAWLKYKGYTGIGSIRVEMKKGTEAVAAEDVKPGKPGEKLAVILRFRESKPGKYTYTVRIPEQQGELRADNNVATYNFQVVDKKVKVLFVEGQDLPRWEYRYLKNALRRDHTTEVDVLLCTGEGNFIWDGTDGKTPLEQFPINRKEMSEYDVLILGDVNPVIFTSEQVNLIRDFVREGGGFVMIAGSRFAPIEYTHGAWAEMLPIVPQRAAYQVPEGGFQDAFQMELTLEGRKLAWTHLDPDDAANRDVWEKLPRLYWYFPVKKKKELATTIATHPFDKCEENDEKGQPKKMPLIVTMPYGSGRTMFIGVDELWRWRREVGDKYHYRFYNQAIRHLSMAKRLGGQKRFYLGSDRNVVAIGDKIVFTAVIKDENYKESTAERAVVHGKTAKNEDFVVEMTRLRDRPGTYEGQYYPTAQGDFAVWLKDDAQPEARQSEVTFKVEKPQLEYENPRLDRELLENLAKAGADGGAYYDIDRLSELPPKVQPVKLEIPRETVFDLWDNWKVFTLFALLITIEWLLRKYGRMI